jgi:hypothetical protein
MVILPLAGLCEASRSTRGRFVRELIPPAVPGRMLAFAQSSRLGRQAAEAGFGLLVGAEHCLG